MIVHHIIRAEGELAEWLKRQNNTDNLYAQIRNKLSQLLTGQMTMGTELQNLNTKVDTLSGTLTKVQTEFQKFIEQHQNGASGAELQALGSKIDGVLSQAAGLDELNPDDVPPGDDEGEDDEDMA